MIYVVLPAYNEEEALSHLLADTAAVMGEARMDYCVIVVDDGSQDRTAAVVRRHSSLLPVSLVQHPQNMGLAAALRTGLTAALEQAGERDIVVTMDSDNTHAPGLIPRMVRLQREGCDVVIASRYQPGSRVVGVPWRRRLMSSGARLLFSLILPTPGVRDYTCGYRAYSVSVLRQAMQYFGDGMIAETGFACAVEILLRLRAVGAIMGEVPMILRYDRKPGQSKMNVSQTFRQTLRLLMRERLGLGRPPQSPE